MNFVVHLRSYLERVAQASEGLPVDAVQVGSISTYAFETRAIRQRTNRVTITPIGRTFLELSGLDAVRWLLAVESAQSSGPRDNMRMSVELAAELLRNPNHYEVTEPDDCAPDQPASPWPFSHSSVRRLAAMGLLEYDEGVGDPFLQGYDWRYVVPDSSFALFEEIAERRTTPFTRLVIALLRDEDAETAAYLEQIYALRGTVGVVRAEPLSASQRSNAFETSWQTVNRLVEHFKHLIEDRDHWREFWEGSAPRSESTAQRLFYMVASSYCEANNLDITPEADTGRGCVDFKISSGFADRILVEMKLSTNRRLDHGYRAQLALYKRAEGTMKAIYLIVDVGDLGQKLKKVRDLEAAARSRGEAASAIVVVDAMPKESASVAREK